MLWRGLQKSFVCTVQLGIIALGAAPALAWPDSISLQGVELWDGTVNGDYFLTYSDAEAASYYDGRGVGIYVHANDGAGTFTSLSLIALSNDDLGQYVGLNQAEGWSLTWDGGGIGPGYVPPSSGGALEGIANTLVGYASAATLLVVGVVVVRTGLKWTKRISGSAS